MTLDWDTLQQAFVWAAHLVVSSWSWCGAQIETQFGTEAATQFVQATIVVGAATAFWASYRVTKFALDRVWWLIGNLVAVSLVAFVALVVAQRNEALLRGLGAHWRFNTEPLKFE